MQSQKQTHAPIRTYVTHQREEKKTKNRVVPLRCGIHIFLLFIFNHVINRIYAVEFCSTFSSISLGWFQWNDIGNEKKKKLISFRVAQSRLKYDTLVSFSSFHANLNSHWHFRHWMNTEKYTSTQQKWCCLMYVSHHQHRTNTNKNQIMRREKKKKLYVFYSIVTYKHSTRHTNSTF